MERENLKSRLGFILLSAGCAIGIGNVWRFPYITGKNGGGAFVLFYLFFLIIVGLPVMTMEFAVGRASRKSIAKSFKVLEKPGQKWHLFGYMGVVGNYLLMMFYTTVTGWMIQYFWMTASGQFEGKSTAAVGESFGVMLSKPGTMTICMVLVVVGGFFICSMGLQNGVERITKVMMVALVVLIVLLAVKSLTLKGGMAGLKFYLFPDIDRLLDRGVFQVAVDALNQSFFTLSIGIGSMAIFGSYLSKNRSLLGESMNIAVLDTFVAVMAGLIIFPACFAFDVQPDSGPSLIFATLPNIFNSMAGGRIWGSLFFVFMFFAAFSTIIAVFENIMSFAMDLWGFSRKKSAFINMGLMILLSMPCILGFNVLSNIKWQGMDIQGIEDFIVSYLLLPIGSLVYLLFSVTKRGWGFKNFLEEANTGDGLKFPKAMSFYVTYILPIFIIVLFLVGIYNTFFA